MKKKIIERYILLAILLVFGILFVARFGGPALLKLYVKSGIGDCNKIPILCMAPTQDLVDPDINKEYLAQLVPYRYPDMEIYLPKGFMVVKEMVAKVYYKKKPRKDNVAAFYLLYKKPNFFVDLFPQVVKQGIRDDYQFISRTMYAKIGDVETVTDVFFMIMKGVFIPDLGDLRNVRMIKFSLTDKRGFINYNLSKTDNYFDCNVISKRSGFFKIYIRDKGATLDLDKVLAIISTVNKL